MKCWLCSPKAKRSDICADCKKSIALAKEIYRKGKKLEPPKSAWPWCIKCRRRLQVYSVLGYVEFYCLNDCKFPIARSFVRLSAARQRQHIRN